MDFSDLQIGAISFVLHREADPSWSIRNLVNEQYDIIAYALSGSVRYTCGKESHTVKKGQMIFFPKGSPHTAMSDRADPWSFISVAFDIRTQSGQLCQGVNQIPFLHSPPYLAPVDSLMLELDRLWARREMGYMVRCRSILMHLLYIMIHSQHQPATTVLHARQIAATVDFLQQNYTQNYSIDFLSEMANLSPSRFRNVFKEYTGFSPNRYQNWLKINKACDMLKTGEFTVTLAARAVGIEDIYYFSRLFKKMTGRNPSEYRGMV